MLLVRSLAITLCVVGLGYLFALATDVHGFDSSSGYFLLATVLLAVGLFSSTYGIEDIRCDIGVVVLAVTVGVLSKAALIAGVMYLVFRNPAYIILGVAVAQIDPLSVAVMRDRSRLSDRSKAILSAWSSFDDPMTAILAIYLAAFALSMGVADPVGPAARGIADAASMPGGFSAFGMGLLGNVLLVVSAAIIWLVLRWLSRRIGRSITDGPGPKSLGLQIAAVLTLLLIAAVAVENFWMLGLAVIGLFFRPGIGSLLQWATQAAFLLAIFILGLVLVDNVNLVPGLALGGAAFGAQIVVGLLITGRLPRRDRVRLALGQQSGITAVILALLLETVFPGTVAVVAPAILVINILHLITNTLLDKVDDRAEKPARPQRNTGDIDHVSP